MTARIERVVVALDAVSENRSAIEAAARLASRWKIRLHAVFIEDDELLRLAVLPFARQVSLGFGVETLTLARAERQSRAYAERARGDLAAAAHRHGIEWSYEAVRGTSGRIAAAASDILVAGTASRPVGGHFRVETRWWAMVEPSAASFLLAHREHRRRGAVACLLHDEAAASERALTIAAELADLDGGALTVICPAELAARQGFQTWLSRQLDGHRLRVAVEPLPAEPAALIREIAELRCRLVVIEAGTAEAQPNRLRELVAQISSDVLVVR